MRILKVCPTYYPDIGGIPHVARNVAERLAKKYDVTVFTTSPIPNKLPTEEEINEVKVKRFRSFAPSNSYFFAPGMFKELRKVKSDIVHGYGYHSLPLLFSRYAKRSKFIVRPSYHGFGHTPIRNLLFNLYRPLGRKIFQDADKIICISSYEKNLLLKDFKIEEDKIVIIPNGVDPEEFKGLKKMSNKSYRNILCVARLEKYKGIHYMIKTLPKLDEDIRLEIVGKGPYEKNLMKLVNTLGLESRVKFFKNLSRKELLERYADADLSVLLSKHEAYGNSVAEALASGTPCIVANTSALREWIDNENCFGVRYPIDLDELASLTSNIIGKSVNTSKFLDWNEVTEKLVDLYRKC